jgi:hypothetical protein
VGFGVWLEPPWCAARFVRYYALLTGYHGTALLLLLYLFALIGLLAGVALQVGRILDKDTK